MYEDLIISLKDVKESPCVSIIIPSELRSFADKESLILKLKESVIQVSKELEKSYDNETIKAIDSNLKKLVDKVNLKSPAKGICLFASRNYHESAYLDIAPKERIVIKDVFDISDLEKSVELFFDYGVLVLSRKETNFYLGSGDQLQKVSNEFFPATFEDEFQVKRADKFSFYNDEESKINQSRRDAYFRNIDNALKVVCANKPCVLVGTIENRSDYKNIKKSKVEIIAEVNGNKDRISLTKLAEEVWASVKLPLDEVES